MVGITLILASLLFIGVQDMSPEIYFHVKKAVVTDITVEIENGVTLTIPEVPLGKRVVWRNVQIGEDGIIEYRGQEYNFLYYEGRFEYKESNYGWMIKSDGGKLTMDGVEFSKNGILDFLEQMLMDSGLHDNEVSFLMDRVAENDMLSFSSDYLLIRYIPMEDVNEAIGLETSFDFEIVRRHFLLQETDEPIEMQVPVFGGVEDSGYFIHETAINRL